MFIIYFTIYLSFLIIYAIKGIASLRIVCNKFRMENISMNPNKVFLNEKNSKNINIKNIGNKDEKIIKIIKNLNLPPKKKRSIKNEIYNYNHKNNLNPKAIIKSLTPRNSLQYDKSIKKFIDFKNITRKDIIIYNLTLIILILQKIDIIILIMN